MAKNTNDDKLKDALQEFASVHKPNTVDIATNAMHERDFGKNGKAYSEIQEIIDTGNAKKLVKTVKDLVTAYKGETQDTEKILNAAGAIMQEKGTLKNPDIILAENIANNMYKAESNQVKTRAYNGAETQLVGPNNVFKEFINEKTGNVQFKDQEALAKFNQKLQQLGTQLDSYQLSPSREAAIEAINSLSTGVDNAKQQERLNIINENSKVSDKKSQELKASPGVGASLSEKLQYNAANEQQAPSTLSSALKQAKAIGRQVKNELKTKKRNIVRSVTRTTNRIKNATLGR
ncbi:MAG: hypothetical protein H6909_03105 [Rickettsiaceae bacterium]|nr:hypothetical protein [Rickettsiaceae bacterium]